MNKRYPRENYSHKSKKVTFGESSATLNFQSTPSEVWNIQISSVEVEVGDVLICNSIDDIAILYMQIYERNVDFLTVVNESHTPEVALLQLQTEENMGIYPPELSVKVWSTELPRRTLNTIIRVNGVNPLANFPLIIPG